MLQFFTVNHFSRIFPRRGCGGPEKDRDFVWGDEHLA